MFVVPASYHCCKDSERAHIKPRLSLSAQLALTRTISSAQSGWAREVGASDLGVPPPFYSGPPGKVWGLLPLPGPHLDLDIHPCLAWSLGSDSQGRV